MYRPVLLAAPAIAPVTLAEAKAHCRVDHDEDDATLTALIAAAVSHLDGWTGILGRCLCEQTWRQDFDAFVRILRLPLAPLIDIVSVAYRDAAGAQQTVDAGDYQTATDELGPYLRFAETFAFPAVALEGPSISVIYKAGYAGTVPPALKHAILLLVGQWYENRSAASAGASMLAPPFAVEALIAPFRRVRF